VKPPGPIDGRWVWIALALNAAGAPFELHAVLRLVKSHYSDFYSAWMGMRGLLHGADSYAPTFTRQIQLGFFGWIPTDPSIDPQAFVYPAHTALLFFPFALMSWKTARIVLTVLLPLLVAATAWMWARLCAVPCNRVLVSILTALTWPAIWAYQQTQLTVVVLAALAASCLLLARNRDWLAGIVLVVATIKPNLSALLIVWLLAQAVLARRWRFAAGFAGPLLALLAASQFLFPAWIPHWLAASQQYSSRSYKPPLLVLILGHTGGLAATVVLAAWVLVLLCRAGKAMPGSHQFAWAAALILAFSTCVIPTTIWMVYNDLALIPSAFLVFGSHGGIKPLNLAARLCVFEVLGAAPVCGLLAIVTGTRGSLVVVPFLSVLLAPILTLWVALPVKSAVSQLLRRSMPSKISQEET
jgi:hypothetical protein